MKLLKFVALLFLAISCVDKTSSIEELEKEIHQQSPVKNTSIVILGTIQDAGSPQIGCKKACCASLFEQPDANRKISSLGLVDVTSEKTYLFEATPDMAAQIKLLTSHNDTNIREVPDGIFLTHAHIGHYTGLMYLGKEAMDAKNMPVYVMPRMKQFLTNNGPWSQLVSRENIDLREMQAAIAVQLSDQIKVTPFLVPHRDEFSETVGYNIKGPNKSALFIPDIDKWEKWEKSIIEEIKKVDYAFLDATFYDSEELNNRDISEIPHPFVVESLKKFENLSPSEKNKIIFIHFNHTNPLINPKSKQAKMVMEQGFRIGKIKDVFEL